MSIWWCFNSGTGLLWWQSNMCRYVGTQKPTLYAEECACGKQKRLLSNLHHVVRALKNVNTYAIDARMFALENHLVFRQNRTTFSTSSRENNSLTILFSALHLFILGFFLLNTYQRIHYTKSHFIHSPVGFSNMAYGWQLNWIQL